MKRRENFQQENSPPYIPSRTFNSVKKSLVQVMAPEQLIRCELLSKDTENTQYFVVTKLSPFLVKQVTSVSATYASTPNKKYIEIDNNIGRIHVDQWLLIAFLVTRCFERNCGFVSCPSNMKLDQEKSFRKNMFKLGIKCFRVKQYLLFAKTHAATPANEEIKQLQLIYPDINPLQGIWREVKQSCICCSLFFLAGYVIPNEKFSIPCAVYHQVKTINSFKNSIREITSLLNLGGGVIVFDWEQKGQKILARGFSLTVQDRERIGSTIFYLMRQVQGQFKMEIDFVPILPSMPSENLQRVIDSSDLYVTRIKVQPLKGQTLFFLKDKVSQNEDYLVFEKGQIKKLQNAEIELTKEKKKNYFQNLDALDEEERLLMKKDCSNFKQGGHQEIPEKSEPSFQIKQQLEYYEKSSTQQSCQASQLIHLSVP